MNANTDNAYENQSTYPWSFNAYSEPRTMPSGWDLSGVLAAQEKSARIKSARRAVRQNAQKQIPLNPVTAQDDARDYRWDTFCGPSTFPSRWNLD